MATLNGCAFLFVLLILPAPDTSQQLSLNSTVQLVAAIQVRFNSRCVFRMLNFRHSLHDKTEAMHLRRLLWKHGVPVQFQSLESPVDLIDCWKDWRLNVVLSSDGNVNTTLLQLSERSLLVRARWLLVLDASDSIEHFLRDVYIPFNCELLVAKGSNATVRLTEVYHVAPGHPLQLKYFGTWRSSGGLISTKSFIYWRRNNLHGIVLNVTTIEHPPTTMLHWEGGKLEVDGLFGTVWKILEQRLNMKTHFKEPLEPEKGTHLGNGSWTGMVGMLLRGEVDVALDMFSLGPYVDTNLTFSLPLVLTRFSLFLRKPVTDSMDWSDYVEPFSLGLWLAVLTAILVLAIALTTVASVGRNFGTSEKPYSLYDSLLYIFGAFCMQGHSSTPKSCACRVVYVVAYFTSIVIVAAYSAALISSLAVLRWKMPYNSIGDLMKDGRYSAGMLKRSEIYYRMKNETNIKLREYFDVMMKPDPDNFPATPMEGLQRACANRYAFIGLYQTTMMLVKHVNCTIVALKEMSGRKNLVFALTPDSPYQGIINHNLQILSDSGTLRRLHESGLFKDNPNLVKTSFVTVSVRSVAPVLVLLAISVVVAVILMALEQGSWFVTKIFKQQHKMSSWHQEFTWDSGRTHSSDSLMYQ